MTRARFWRGVGSTVAMTVAGLAIAAAAACSTEGARPTAVIQAPDSADQVLSGFSHNITRDGIRRSFVTADTAYFYEPTQLTVLKHVKAVFYSIEGSIASTMTSDRAVYRWQDGAMDAEGHVIVTNPDGQTLRTEKLKYDDANKRISTDQPFTFDKGTDHLEGKGFRSDPDFKNVVAGQPRGTAGDAGIDLPGQED